MNQIIIRLLFVSFIVCFSLFTVNAQSQVKVEQKEQNIVVVGAKKTLEFSGKATVVIAKETAKIAWATTKFTAKEIVAPVAKTLVVKVAPKVAKTLLKQSGNLIEKGVPIAAKAVITYLKF